jgi:hypothetical protein
MGCGELFTTSELLPALHGIIGSTHRTVLVKAEHALVNPWGFETTHQAMST